MSNTPTSYEEEEEEEEVKHFEPPTFMPIPLTRSDSPTNYQDYNAMVAFDFFSNPPVAAPANIVVASAPPPMSFTSHLPSIMLANEDDD